LHKDGTIAEWKECVSVRPFRRQYVTRIWGSDPGDLALPFKATLSTQHEYIALTSKLIASQVKQITEASTRRLSSKEVLEILQVDVTWRYLKWWHIEQAMGTITDY
jgi:hypothetical protein